MSVKLSSVCFFFSQSTTAIEILFVISSARGTCTVEEPVEDEFVRETGAGASVDECV